MEEREGGSKLFAPNCLRQISFASILFFNDSKLPLVVNAQGSLPIDLIVMSLTRPPRSTSPCFPTLDCTTVLYNHKKRSQRAVQDV